MSITVTTDVFCDFCDDWVFGTEGPRQNSTEARATAKRHGWERILSYSGSYVDVCPKCKDNPETA